MINCLRVKNNCQDFLLKCFNCRTLKVRKRLQGIIIALFITSVFFSACNKKPDQVGLGLQPTTAELSVIFDDNSGLYAHSLREDSVRTDGNAVQTASVGSMMDPVFGRTDAQIFTQLRLSENGHSFGDAPVLDSLILSLGYTSFYGDTMASQTIRVYELADSLNQDSIYYSNQTVADLGTEIGSLTFVPNFTDSINVGGTLYPAHLRISLNEDFALKILNAETTVFDDNESWLDFMKGIRITADQSAGEGGIILFDMFSVLSSMTMYYRTGDPEDTLSFSFLSNSNCARFTSFDHNDYLDASMALQAQILNGDTLQGQEFIYLQAMGGVKAQLRLPDIQEFFDDGPVSINEARLVFNVYDDGSDLGPPPQLALAKIDEEGDYVLLPDAAESSTYYGGSLNDGDDQYFFRISRHVQQILTGESPNYPLILLISGGSFRANRLILHGPDEASNADERMMLKVIYTRLN